MRKENITVIQLGFVNAFLVKLTDGFVLIDTGVSSQWEMLESALQKSGCLPGTLKLVVITHGDFDHTGNCARLKEKYGCPVAMHPADFDMAEKAVTQKRKIRTLPAKIFYMIRRLKRRKSPFETFTPDIRLFDGQSLATYGMVATVIHLPGHTRGSVGILGTDGSLMIGDTFVNRDKPEKALYIENAKDLEHSIDRLKTLPVKTVYPGHGKPFEMAEIADNL